MVQIFSAFEHTINVELMIQALEKDGIAKGNIFAVPLTNRKAERRLFDTMHESDGVSLISTGAALATALSVIGASVGYKLAWGPIYWGLIGAAVGFIVGLGIDLFYYKVIKKQKRLIKGKHAELIIIVECEDHQADSVEDVMWHHFALGTARIITDSSDFAELA